MLARTFILHVKSRGSFETAVKIDAFISIRQGTETVDVKETTVTLNNLEYGVTYRVNITATSSAALELVQAVLWLQWLLKHVSLIEQVTKLLSFSSYVAYYPHLS